MSDSILKDKNIILGVTGSISCYKSIDLASKLMQLGANVYVILSDSAQQFVSALTFTSITHLPVVTEMFNENSKFSVEHVALAEMADLILISPATANTIAKLAHGFSDDSLTTTVLATKAPVIVAPAMDANMYDNPIVQSNISMLESRGFTMAGPNYGRMASGLEGWGRLLETEEVISHINLKLGEHGDLEGCKIVVSAGGTSEPIDPVRVITNRSSGKMGYSIAIAALERGAQVSLISASNSLPDPLGIKVSHVETVSQMRDSVLLECSDADAVIMAAAISDYRVKEVADNKIKKVIMSTYTSHNLNSLLMDLVCEKLRINQVFFLNSVELLYNNENRVIPIIQKNSFKKRNLIKNKISNYSFTKSSESIVKDPDLLIISKYLVPPSISKIK